MTRRLTALKGLLLTALLLVSALLAGCHDIGGTTSEYPGDGPAEGDPAEVPADDEDGNSSQEEEQDGPDEQEDAEGNASQEPPRLDLELVLAPVSGPIFTEDSVDLQVEVDGDNFSYQELDWAGIRWTQQATSERDPTTGPEDGHDGLATEDDPRTGAYAVNDWRPVSATTYYLRAHLQADGHHYWSDEIAVAVTEPVEEVEAEADETVRFRTNLTDPCEGDTYSQDPLEIEAGTVVQWENAANCAHTATHDADDPLFDTGQIEPNNASTYNYRFNKPGTYEIRCGNHPGMDAQIIVG